MDHSFIGGEFRPKQVYEQVADRIRNLIDSGAFAVGDRLPAERELAGRLGVSRPAVREAIGALQNEGRVVTRHGSGTYVMAVHAAQGAGPTATDQAAATERVADLSPVAILETRLIIEPAIARLAARRGKRDAQAERYLDEMSDVTDIDDPILRARWSQCDRLFHRQIAIMTEDPLIAKIAEEIAKSMDEPLWNRLRDDGIYDPERIRLYVAEHRMIYEAIVCGDGDAAALYVEGHIKRVQRDIAPR